MDIPGHLRAYKGKIGLIIPSPVIVMTAAKNRVMYHSCPKRVRDVAGAWGSLFKNEGNRAKTLQKGSPKAGGGRPSSIHSMEGFSWPFPQEAFRPPNPSPYAVCRAPAFSFLKRDPHAPTLYEAHDSLPYSLSTFSPHLMPYIIFWMDIREIHYSK
jgi:hypothetical protein